MINREKRYFLFDMYTSIKINIRLMMSSRAVVICMLFSITIFAIMIGTLSYSAKERSNIPIGVLDEDNTGLSRKLVKKLKSAEFVLVFEEAEVQLKERLDDRTISGYVVIKKGYERNVSMGNVTSLINMYYKSENGVFSMVSDVIAGEMADDICAGRTWIYYEDLRKKYPELDDSQLLFQYVDNARSEKGKNLLFEVEMVDVKKNKNVTSQVDNSILYKQIVIGIVSILFGFLSMITVGTLKNADNIHVRKRRRASRIPESIFSMGQAGAIFIFLFGVGGISSIFLLYSLGIENSVGCITSLLIIMQSFLILVGAYGIIFYLLGKCTGDKIAYPLIGTLMVIVMGAVGVIGYFDAALLNISKFMPNYWFITRITDIMVSGS